jgi:thiol-disulfide isomerase/thioredoxin
MKGFLWAVCVLMFGFSGFTQQVKNVKINAIEELIQKSDHPVIISFWATWCLPCVHEIPYFQETVKKYQDKNVELVLVSLDFKESYPSVIESFVRKKNYQASFYWLNETNADQFCPKIDPNWDGSIPATLFVNNKTNYRKFYDRQLTPLQVEAEVKAQVKE